MYKAMLAVSVCVLTLAAPSWAKDIVSMPEATMMGPGEVEMAYIYWDLDAIRLGPGGPWARDYAHVGEFYIGVLPWLELDVIHVDPQGPIPGVTELNAYVRIQDETRSRPAITIGATNLTSADWLPSIERMGPDGDYRVSPFIMLARTLRMPLHGPPNWDDPAIRLQLGYGWNFHEDEVFGILQFAFTPNVVAGVQYYQRDWGWLVGWQQDPGWGIHVGALAGDPYVHIRYNFSLPR